MSKTVTVELTELEFGWLDDLTRQQNANVPVDETISPDEMAAIILSLTVENIYKSRKGVSQCTTLV